MTLEFSASAKPRPHVLKDGDCFAVLDALGDAQATPPAAEGLFYEDTRYLSQLVLAIDELRPLLLSSTISDDGAILVADLTTPDLVAQGRLRAARNTIHLLRSSSIGEDALFVRLELCNFGSETAALGLSFDFDADFADIFELRGTARRQHGRRLADETTADGAILAYLGRDDVIRRLRLNFWPPPENIKQRHARWEVTLPTRAVRLFEMTARCELDGRPSRGRARQASLSTGLRRTGERAARGADIRTSNDAFNGVVRRARADLDMLITETPEGLFAYAGLPWFSTAFGRDGLLTALECLWLDPALAAGTLRFLALRQATQVDPKVDAEPGKILHETRKSEMAALGEVPFGRYYGSIDATPLFVVLAAAYYARTGDISLINEIWPNVQAALRWMAEYGDADGDGFLEYDRKSVNGLVNQGWKDSGDAIFHADGRIAEAPIALAEVQSYAFAAYLGAADLAAALGQTQQAIELTAVATRLKQRFDSAFWLEEFGTFALALDGAKRPCRVRASNAGQVLLGGLAAPEQAVRVADGLMSPRSFSRWGIRTIAEGEARYNPMSYHNGSVWPHDNGLIAMGFARYALQQPLIELVGGLVDAALVMPLQRVPELFCGFTRRRGIGPTTHPMACAPQAWSAAAIFAMLGALIGISFDPSQRRICLARPTLPPALDKLDVMNLRLGDAEVDLQLHRNGESVDLHVTRRDGDVEVVVTN